MDAGCYLSYNGLFSGEVEKYKFFKESSMRKIVKKEERIVGILIGLGDRQDIRSHKKHTVW